MWGSNVVCVVLCLSRWGRKGLGDVEPGAGVGSILFPMFSAVTNVGKHLFFYASGTRALWGCRVCGVISVWLPSSPLLSPATDPAPWRYQHCVIIQQRLALLAGDARGRGGLFSACFVSISKNG